MNRMFIIISIVAVCTLMLSVTITYASSTEDKILEKSKNAAKDIKEGADDVVNEIEGMVKEGIGQKGLNESNLTDTPVGNFEGKDLSVSNLRTGEFNDRVVIAGTIKNSSDRPITGISYAVETYNSSNENIGTLVMSGQKLPLEPQEEYTFEIHTSNIPSEVDHYTVRVTSER